MDAVAAPITICEDVIVSADSGDISIIRIRNYVTSLTDNLYGVVALTNLVGGEHASGCFRLVNDGELYWEGSVSLDIPSEATRDDISHLVISLPLPVKDMDLVLEVDGIDIAYRHIRVVG